MRSSRPTRASSTVPAIMRSAAKPNAKTGEMMDQNTPTAVLEMNLEVPLTVPSVTRSVPSVAELTRLAVTVNSNAPFYGDVHTSNEKIAPNNCTLSMMKKKAIAVRTAVSAPST